MEKEILSPTHQMDHLLHTQALNLMMMETLLLLQHKTFQMEQLRLLLLLLNQTLKSLYLHQKILMVLPITTATEAIPTYHTMDLYLH